MALLQADEIFVCLDRHRVLYVVVGGLAATWTFRPAGTEGFADLARQAVEVTIRGVGVSVAALEDVIRSKEAADRPKDRRSLPVLVLGLDRMSRSPVWLSPPLDESVALH